MAGHDGDQATAKERQLGSEIGSTICFKFHEEALLGALRSDICDGEELDWASFYHYGFAAP
jgi:hypothetical protein